MQFTPNELADVIINKTSSEDIEYHDVLPKAIFYNDFVDYGLSTSTFKNEKEISLNRFGFRSPEFKNGIDFLFSGCSVTYGVGLNEEDLWHSMLARELDIKYASVAYPGDSVASQVLKIFAYIKEFGSPKNIVCLFPNFDRFLMFNNKNLLASNQFFRYYQDEHWVNMMCGDAKEDDKNAYLYNLLRASSDIHDTHGRPKYFKVPLISNDVITQEISHMYSAQMINMLSQYCQLANINLIWSTWDSPSARLINEVKNELYFKEYVDMGIDHWDRNFEKVTDLYTLNQGDIHCHYDQANHAEFHFASDRIHGIGHAHYGFHRHLHFFDTFLNEIKLGK